MCSAKGRLTCLGMKKVTGGRHVYDAEYRPIIFQQCQGNRPNRNPRLEIIHSVNGVKNPEVSFFIVRVGRAFMANWVRSSIPLFSAGAILTSLFEIYEYAFYFT